MTDKRLFLALAPLGLLAACGEEPAGEGRAATGDVLEGSISDAMLPVDRVQSEPPLEDPEAFAEVQEKAAAQAPGGSESEGDEPADPEAAEPAEPAVEVPTFEAQGE
jgi:hypothetical protein